MNKISNAIKCFNCSQVLQSPVLLPCKHSICKRHTQTANEKSITCHQCGAQHAKPDEGFLENDSLRQIIEAQIDKLNFGETHNQATKSCNQLENLINEFKFILAEPSSFTEQTISELENRVLLKREGLLLKINQESDKVLKLLGDYKKSCCHSNKKFPDDWRVLTTKVQTIETKLNAWYENLDEVRFEEKKWNEIKSQSEKETNILQEDLGKLKELLLSSSYRKANQLVDVFEGIKLDSLFGLGQESEEPILWTRSQNLMPRSRVDSVIITPELTNEFIQLCEFFSQVQRLKLIYRGSRDGLRFRHFFRCCLANNTLMIIQTAEGHIHGGYSHAPLYLAYPLGKTWKKDANAFVFSLRNWAGVSLKISLSDENKAVCFDTRYLRQIWYFGEDLGVNFNFNPPCGFINLGNFYKHSSCSNCVYDHSALINRRVNFDIKEIELFSVQN